MRRLARIALALAVLAAAGSAARAATLTGTLTPAYGAPLVVQTTQTTLDAPPGATVNMADGDELDAGYATIADGVLHLFLTGNMARWIQLEGGIPHALPIDLFLDTRPGGQNQLLANNPVVVLYDADLTRLTGLRFDPGFEADWWFCVGANLLPEMSLAGDEAELPTGGGGAGATLGTGTFGGPGTLAGGSNPCGVEVTVDDRNAAGVSHGCGASSGAGVTTGIEWSIPLAAIGNPAGCIRICAFVSSLDHSQLFNQVLGPLPPGTCDLGAAAGVDFGAIAGEQFFTVCPEVVPARHTTWGALKGAYR